MIFYEHPGYQLELPFHNAVQVIIVSDAHVTAMNRFFGDYLLTRAPDFGLSACALYCAPPPPPPPERRPEIGPPPRLVRAYEARQRPGLSTPLLQFRASQRDSRRLARQRRLNSYSRKLAARFRKA